MHFCMQYLLHRDCFLHLMPLEIKGIVHSTCIFMHAHLCIGDVQTLSVCVCLRNMSLLIFLAQRQNMHGCCGQARMGACAPLQFCQAGGICTKLQESNIICSGDYSIAGWGCPAELCQPCDMLQEAPAGSFLVWSKCAVQVQPLKPGCACSAHCHQWTWLPAIVMSLMIVQASTHTHRISTWLVNSRVWVLLELVLMCHANKILEL